MYKDHHKTREQFTVHMIMNETEINYNKQTSSFGVSTETKLLLTKQTFSINEINEKESFSSQRNTFQDPVIKS